jgi:hypothetical protein
MHVICYAKQYKHVSFEVFIVVRMMMMMIFWVLEVRVLVSTCQHFRKTYFHIQGWSGNAGSRGIYVWLEEGKAGGVGQSGMKSEKERSKPTGGLQTSDGWGRGLGRELEDEGIGGPFEGQ